jgi:hypothetical protein
MSNLSFTSKINNLPAFYLCIRYIEGQRYLAICYPTYFRVAKLFQPSPCLYSDSFPSFHACKVYIYRNPQLKSNINDFEPLQLFFGWIFFNHILEKVLDICKYHYVQVCFKTAQPQKSHFFKNTIYL